MITAKLGEKIINCFNGEFDKETLKKWSNKNILLCPVCGKPYEYCHGEFKIPYFRHKDKTECKDFYNEPETEEHINGKQDLYKWISIQDNVSDVILEGWLPETHQRPDIMFKYNNKQYAIEYQCTPISTEYLERHKLYKSAGIIDIWILGTDKYLNKSELKTNFRTKQIENYVDIYYDSEYKIFITNNILNIINPLKEHRITPTYIDIYRNIEFRKNIDTLSYDGIIHKYMVSMTYIVYQNGQINLTPDMVNIIKEITHKILEQEKQAIERDKKEAIIKTKCEVFLKKVFEEFKKYHIEFYRMSCNLGFKSNKHYFQLKNTHKYPIVELYEIIYLDNTPVYNKVFDFNIKDDICKVTKYLKSELKDVIKINNEIHDFETNYLKIKNDEFNNIKNELNNFKNKKLYLLFLEDNNSIGKNIKFKLMVDYYDNINKTGMELIKILKFLDSKGADKYVLMIPRKKLKASTSMLYPYYKVLNNQLSVKNDFNELGLDFLEYKDLI